VYILKLSSGLLYTGITTDVQRRIKEHHQKDSRVELLYRELCSDQYAAAKRERQIKRWTRRKKLALISGDLALLKKL
jgi:predicted GIY-YIG superfamily endonuclease